MKKCKQGYYYCYTDEVCKPIPKGLRVTARFSGGGKEPEETGIDVPTNGNGDGNGDGGGGMSEGSLRKWFKGSDNYGNKSESVEFSDWRDDFQAMEYEFVDIIKPEPIKGGQEQIDEGQKCWKGYVKKGTKKMFGKTYNNCVKKEGYDVGDVDQKVGAVTPIPKSEQDAARARLLAKAKAKREKMKEEKEESKVGGGNLKKLTAKAVKRVDADVDGDVDTDDMKSPETGEFVPSPDGKKKLKPKVRFEGASDWRSELEEGWKSALAGAGVAAALMSQGGQKAPDKKTTTSPSRSNTERVSKTTQKTLSPMDKWRKNHPELAKKSDNPSKFNRKKLSPINKDWAKANPKLAEKEKDNRSKLGEAIDKSKMKCNSPKSQAVGDSQTGKSHVVKACESGKEKIIRFGQKGVKGSPKKEGESKEYASRRNRFKTRHAKNISKGKMSAAYWSDKVKW